ncbi:hypothetical protein SAMN05216548_114131 [Faunimonas pinastri]|uniref:Uncharacterized protein n=1 Tax=Faunimonas pinastri TaxID=1855383 RepID=A0A1H9N0M1_9HYPH|nr:hypothetical protein [Faunimonas pinastri]SER29448.1 hypothetical protein SAMN05216548_114131 [Faunimonas pinastri]
MRNETRRPIEIARKGERQPFKPKLWSHQQQLRELRGRKIVVLFRDGTQVTGELLEADQYALLLRIREDKSVLTLTLFKHDIQGYRPAE